MGSYSYIYILFPLPPPASAPTYSHSAALAFIPSNSFEQLLTAFKAPLFKIVTNILYFSVLSPSLPLMSQTMTKMKRGRERLLVKGWAATLACHLLLGRSQLITFAISVHFQKIGLQKWPFCCLTF